MFKICSKICMWFLRKFIFFKDFDLFKNWEYVSCFMFLYVSLCLTLVQASVLVFKNGEFVNLAKLLEHGTEGILFEMTRYLSYEEFDGILSVAGRGGC